MPLLLSEANVRSWSVLRRSRRSAEHKSLAPWPPQSARHISLCIVQDTASNQRLHPAGSRNLDASSIQILTIETLLHGANVQMPPTAQTFKQAPKADSAKQHAGIGPVHVAGRGYQTPAETEKRPQPLDARPGWLRAAKRIRSGVLSRQRGNRENYCRTPASAGCDGR